jgi:hypothetical protein
MIIKLLKQPNIRRFCESLLSPHHYLLKLQQMVIIITAEGRRNDYSEEAEAKTKNKEKPIFVVEVNLRVHFPFTVGRSAENT